MSDTQATTIVQIQKSLDRLRAARDELIAVAADRLRLLTRQMLRDYPDVHRWEQTDDVMQKAVLRLCRALEAVPLATARDFFRVAALQVRRELRDLKKHYYGPEGLGAHHHSGSLPEGKARPANEREYLKLWERFEQAVEKLPDDERDIFHLRWGLELSTREAAETLKISESTVKRRFQDARRRLHDLLGGELPF